MILIIDGPNVVYKAWVACGMKDLLVEKDNPAELTDTVMNELLRSFMGLVSSYIQNSSSLGRVDVELYVVWESADSLTYRRSIIPEYKNKPKKDNNKISDYTLVKPACIKLMAILKEIHPLLSLTISGLEADDLIAGICLLNPKAQKLIVSRDKDMHQLVNSTTNQYDPFNKKLIRESDVTDTLGVLPQEVACLKALMGDTSDNYKGVAGIGKVKALKLIHSGEVSLYENCEEYKNSMLVAQLPNPNMDTQALNATIRSAFGNGPALGAYKAILHASYIKAINGCLW